MSLDQSPFPAQGPTERTRPDSPFSQLAERALAELCAPTETDTVSADIQDAAADPLATAMAYALCDTDEESAELLVEDLLSAGLSVEEVCLNHLAPAARRLGDWWDTDRLPFTEVTVATARIQSLMRRLPKGGVSRPASNECGAIFAAVPGEMHTLGVIMAADLFRRGGWDVSLAIDCSHVELLARLKRDDRPMIGLSCSGSHSFPALQRLLTDLARTRPDAKIVLSGQILTDLDRMAQLPQVFTPIADMAAAERFMTDTAAELMQAARTARRDLRRLAGL